MEIPEDQHQHLHSEFLYRQKRVQAFNDEYWMKYASFLGCQEVMGVKHSPPETGPPLRSTVVRVSARGA